MGLEAPATELGFRVAFQEAPASGRGVAQYEPHGEAAAEVRAMVTEVLALVGLNTTKKTRS